MFKRLRFVVHYLLTSRHASLFAVCCHTMSLKLNIVLTLAIHLPSVKGFATLGRREISGPLPFANLDEYATAAEVLVPTQVQRVTNSPTQSALHHQGPSFTAVNVPKTALDALPIPLVPDIATQQRPDDAVAAKDLLDPTTQSFQIATTSLSTTNTDTSITMIPVGNGPEIADQTARSLSVQSAPKVAKVSSSTLQPSTTTARSILKTPSKIALPHYDINTPMSTLPIEARPGFLSNTHTITLNSRSQDIFSSSQTLSPNTTVALGSGIPLIVLFIQTSGTQALPVSVSSIPLSSYASITPKSSKKTIQLIKSEETMKANSLGQFHNNTQTLTPGSFITISGSTISLAPGKSAIVVGTSTRPLTPSVAASIGSSPNGTEVQKFANNGVGARDELWSSSILLLVAFAVLLRL